MFGSHHIVWATDSLTVSLDVDSEGSIYLADLQPTNSLTNGVDTKRCTLTSLKSSALPLNAVRLVGEGNTGDKTSKSLIGSYLSKRMRYHSHEESRSHESQCLKVVAFDEVTRIKVTTYFTVFLGIPVLRAVAEILNESSQDIVVSQISSLCVGGLTSGNPGWWQEYTLSTATNSWFREAQWREDTLPNIGIDDNRISLMPGGMHGGSMANFSLSNRGSFSTGTYLPMGLLQRKDQKDTWLWQVESNGSWRWEIGDLQNDIYLAAGGPTAVDHDWKQSLAPGDSFTGVPVALCHVYDNTDQALGALTRYRRCMRRKHNDNEAMSLIFNDYMNCLMGDPDEDKIKALLPAVARCGAEYFVIDAGWYADDNGWWDDVGEWEPSKRRFPSGFKNLLATIRSYGLIPGVWLEPEVIGVRSAAVRQLPEDAFFQDCGQRIVERGRHQLDYRHEAVRSRMTQIVDKLVDEYGVGYFKFDYNIEVVAGTDLACSRGVGQLDHNRAYLSWVNSLYDRHPDLVIESCSSGAQRMDYAMLSVHSLQSTSDQEDPVLYAAIAAAVPTAVTPEQSATWAYPQSKWDAEINALTVVNSLLGRVHLSGRLDQLNDKNCSLIAEGMAVYKRIRSDLKTALPFWPLGFPHWHDDWLALGMTTQAGEVYLSVWRRGGPQKFQLPLAPLRGEAMVQVDLLYPRTFEASARWNTETGKLDMELPQVTCARLFHIRSQNQ
ncbi:uncharacterized protein Z518_09639 [Rhinocladiella mackenziei CBS 650.93]|uniref:alpha-galactosidase n=1 Tax=Rhinocladiella mackenziei CBS 650.93 TaxID=1442369 RepID=A0A0D2I482_9EURO|nr:uncharacterized protein Z518_09639 [Rhinocladiella mackenziei CBS 650.93]KIX00574.1 hypothetical protein Z518_09639 [Rhinocladiella mackenziei CBS 650.93]